MDNYLNKFYNIGRGLEYCACRAFDFEPDDILAMFLNDDRMLTLLFHSEDGRLVNDLDLHISHKGLSPEMLNLLHSIQQEHPYISGIPFDKNNLQSVDDFITETIVSRYNQIGSYLSDNVDYIKSRLDALNSSSSESAVSSSSD